MKTRFLKSILVLAALSAAFGGAYAQTQESPESVAKAYFAAMQAADWAKCASYMHPDALASMKLTFAEAIDADKSGDAARTIFKLKSASEYSQLSEKAVFERLMDFITSVTPDMKAILASSTNAILGRVDEGPDLVHIVFRTRIKHGDVDMNEVDLISFKKQGSTWRALLTSDLEEMLNRFVEEMAPEPKEEEKSPPEGAGKAPRKP